MIASMDLNASPQPEDDDEIFGHQLEEESEEHIVQQINEHTDYVESAVEISRRVHLFPYLFHVTRCIEA